MGAIASAGEELASALTEARAQWPGLAISDEAFIEFIGDKLGAPEPRRWSELYLVCGCARRDAAALKLFDQHYLQPLARRLTPRGLADEAIQELRHSLFVGPQPQIAGYSGRGPLANWLRVMGVRAVQKLRVREERELGRGAVEDVLVDPELDFIKAAQRPVFAKAFREAIEGLTVRERMLLRLHYGEGISADALATTHGVHRATATRWLQTAREKLLDGLRARLIELLSLSSRDADSLLRLARSQLEFSLRGALR